MLLILMYHKIVDGTMDLDVVLDKFEKHLRYLKQNFTIVVPGQNLSTNNICLTFDDAYADFYYYVFPLLKKLNIPAVLGIPTGLINDGTNLEKSARLNSDLIDFQGGSNHNLCTWEEIRTMVSSGLVYPASHSLSHQNLNNIVFSQAYEEICLSKRNILTKLEKITETLIYPFGKYNHKVHNMSQRHYQYIMRIGGAINLRWKQKILYRVEADPFWKHSKFFSRFNFLSWNIKYYINMLRGK